MIPRPLPYLHLVEPHEKPLRDDPDPPYVAPSRYLGVIMVALLVCILASWGYVVWRLWS
jgi:hypothetical protein